MAADEIRFLGDLQRLQIQPGDVFVLSTEQRMTVDTAERIRAMCSQALDGAKVLVLGDGLRISMLSEWVDTTALGDEEQTLTNSRTGEIRKVQRG